MKYKLADIAISRKLCNLKQFCEAVREGRVSVEAEGIGVSKVDSPNDAIDTSVYTDAPIMLNIENHGKTKIYHPHFRGKHLVATRYDYGDFEWEVIERANAIVAAPVLDGDKIVLAKVYRPVIHDWLFELPAGMMHPHEHAHDTALRELEEETGYTAGRVDYLWSALCTPGYSTEDAHFYLCTDLKEGEQQLDAEEKIVPAIYTISDAFALIRQGLIRDMKTIAAISYLQTFTGDDTCLTSQLVKKSAT